MGLMYAEQVEYLDVEEMQQTHEDEIALLNEINALTTEYQRDSTKIKPLEEKLDAYIVHVKAHFANEERLMKEYDFPLFEMHKMAHDMFLMDLTYAVNQWKKFGDIEKMINFVHKSPEWIVMHINTVDAPTANFLAQKMDS